MLEPFSIISQSLTLSNRLSINILAGSLLIPSLSVAVIIFSTYLILCYWISSLYLIIYSFEILNSLVQLFIFNLLSIEYLVILILFPIINLLFTDFTYLITIGSTAVLIITGSIYFILLDELVMGSAQRRIGPLNLGFIICF